VALIDRAGLLGVRGDRVEREVGVVSLAKQHSQCSVPLAAITRRRREPPPQEGQRAFHLAVGGVRVALGECILDEIGVRAAREQCLPNPVTPPLFELALVLNEQADEPSVIQVSLLDKGGDRPLDVLGIGASASKVRTHLGLRPLTPVQIAVSSGERLLKMAGAGLRVQTGAGVCARLREIGLGHGERDLALH